MIKSTHAVARGLCVVLLGISLLAACASSPESLQSGSNSTNSIPEVYNGVGQDESLLSAMNKAKMDAVRNAVIALIGESAEAAHQSVLEERLYSTSNPNQYVYPESMETLRRENLGDIDHMNMVYEIRIRVNIDRVRQFLEGNGIGSSASTASDGAQAVVQNALSESDASSSDSDENLDVSEASAEEQAYVQRYLNNMTYMVYFPEETSADPFLMKTAVTQANSWLTSEGYRVVDISQIEQLKSDASLVYEEQTGGELSLLQWIAQRLNADVYVELDAQLTSRDETTRFYGQAILSMKMFETSTAQLLGSVPYTSPETFSRSSAQDALANALQSSVYQAMPYVVEQSRVQMSRQVSHGIRYELVFLNTDDSRLMSRFRANLREQVRDVETVSQSPEETKYAVYAFARVDELEEIIYRVADQTPGLEYLSLVLTRGKTMTFDTGLLP